MREQIAFTPLKWSLVWMLGTFGLFLLVGEIGRVPNMVELALFVLGTTGTFAFGYWARVKSWHRPAYEPAPVDAAAIRRWVVVSALFCAVFGLAFLRAYGASGPGAVIEALRHPGAAYFFRLRDAQLAPGNTLIQILTLGAALTTPLVPFTIIWWKGLTPTIRLLALAGGALYCSYWVFIGTQKGIGDFACYAAVALLARAAIVGRGIGRKAVAWVAILGVAFGLYMVFNQSGRLTAANATGGIKPNPIASAIAGDSVGRGVTTTIGYPTNGYLGLAYNLGTPVTWTKFRGSSRAFDSYWTEYVDPTAQPIFPDTLPAHTEQRTGWPALTNWCTIYPWLASDLTWWGVPPFMLLVGWWTARWWLETIYLRNKLALLLIGQMAIFIAYVPANNQLGITRPGLLAFAALLGLYASGRIHAALSRRVRVRPAPRYTTPEGRSGHGQVPGLV